MRKLNFPPISFSPVRLRCESVVAIAIVVVLVVVCVATRSIPKSCTVYGSGAIAYRQSAYCETIDKFSPPIICVLELSEYPLH